MTVPQLSLGWGKGLVERGRNHVFNADKSGIGLGGVIDETLADICVAKTSALRFIIHLIVVGYLR